jgi:N-methylhydantoinase B/oxoprolinase/acetone carboxylase alpha subunit
MNNLLLGASEPVAFAHYETLGGGEGAPPTATASPASTPA